MVKFLEEKGIKWVPGMKYPDNYPEKPDGKIGRSLEAEIFDARKLGEMAENFRIGGLEAPIPLYSGVKVTSLPKAFTNFQDFTTVVGMFINGFKHKIKREKPLSIGAGLVASLMKIVNYLKAPVWLSTPLKDMLTKTTRLWA
ncbi:hypothetical protein J2Z83_001375 [Virgibacillus natechei]|uniref:Uncharacterized protein n=1 Tax=Virgibacillus natechei TaxID=1216297 RepID=A0ABS4IE85_9BACI|nr:hypothetical protein [Virgibacillus natechei]MBP1969271.1 hypothetical protein [Virgibacillus natechei]UZD12428.1 hypothetical protein OLD84_16180 [Virgibacillus natechei]